MQKMKSVKGISFLLVLMIATQGYGAEDWHPAPAGPGERVGCFISTGDNDNLFYSPSVDSPAAIDDYFDILQRVYGVQRIYWRAMQAAQVMDYSLVREDNFYGYHYAQWERHLNKVVGTGKYGVQAAHARDMTIWGIASLFDHGAQAVVDASKGFGPLPWEMQVRVDHPEWVPTDRYGVRRMAGPICFAYPDARMALINMYRQIAVDCDYDGILFFLYTEQFQARCAEEFGFNEPIVAEYRRRYGIDITAEDVDPYALARLRGEYLTQFFRELRAALASLDIKIGVCISPITPDYPQPWLADPDMMVSGRVLVDYRRYVQEALVDELHVYAGGTPYELTNEILALTENTGCAVSMMSSSAHPAAYRHFAGQAVIRVIYGGYDVLADGYLQEQPVAALDGDDFIARLTVLHQMASGKMPANIQRIVAACRDEHVYVRRGALKAIGQLKLTGPEVIAAVEEALDDPENAVRCYAVDTLAKIGDADSIDGIFTALDTHHNFMIDLAAAWALAKLPTERNDCIGRGLNHPSGAVRKVALQACSSGEYRYGLLPELLKLADDEDAEVRWLLARVFSRHVSPEAIEVLFRLLDDSHPTVRNMATSSLGTQLQSQSRWVGPTQYKLIQKLEELFARYNVKYADRDADWGWRCVGEALQTAGPRGVEVLNKFLAQGQDEVLADHAWQVLYVQQSAYRFIPVSAEEMLKGYQFHPALRKNLPQASAVVAEPAMMPYLVQDFDGEMFTPGQTGDVGQLTMTSGLWRHLGSEPPAPMVVAGADLAGIGNSIRLTRASQGNSSYLDAIRADYRLTTGKAIVRLQVYLAEEASQLQIWFTDSGQWASNLAVRLGDNGQIQYQNEGGNWRIAPTTIPLKTWQGLEMDIDFDALHYSVFLGAERTTIAAEVELKPAERYNVLVLMPLGAAGNRSYVDDVNITATNPAGNHGDNQNIDLEEASTPIHEVPPTTAPAAMDKDRSRSQDATNVLSPQRSQE